MDILSLFFPPRCPYCGDAIPNGETECSECRSKFPDEGYMRIIPSGNLCISPFVYDSDKRYALLRYKFRNDKYCSKSLAKQMYRVICQFYADERIEVVCAVPMMKKQKRQRGFNQSQVLAEQIARMMDIPCEELLIKTKINLVQHELDREQRKTNVIGVYSLSNVQMIKHKRILVVDDICTTGNTLAECCRVLLKGGAEEVFCVAAANSSHY